MNEIDTRNPVPVTDRQPWQPLGYDKISAADAEGSFAGLGTDNSFYS